MLVKQYENINNKEAPYGVILYPKDDWNGAFHSDGLVFSELMDGLNRKPELKDYLVRVFECSSKSDVARALIGLNKTYGDHHKISFAIIGGHGMKDTINFGGGEFARNYLFSKDLQGKGVRRTGGFFEPEATVVLASCSTGEQEGIGQTLSENFGMKVIAPNMPTALDAILPKFVNGKIDFDVKYYDRGASMVYSANKTK